MLITKWCNTEVVGFCGGWIWLRTFNEIAEEIKESGLRMDTMKKYKALMKFEPRSQITLKL